MPPTRNTEAERATALVMTRGTRSERNIMMFGEKGERKPSKSTSNLRRPLAKHYYNAAGMGFTEKKFFREVHG